MSKVMEQGKKYNLYSWSAQKNLAPANIVDAKGIYFWDETGKKYYDMSSQLVNVNLGHKNQAVIDAIKAQADKLPFIAPSFSCDVRSQAAEMVVEASGLKGAKVFFVNAGAESNENAIKMAKMYTGKWKIFSMYRCYHGATYGSANLTGEPRRYVNEPGIPGFIKYNGPYPYRAPKHVKLRNEDEAAEYYLQTLEEQILYENPDAIAAIFMETVVGSNGVLVPPKKWIQGVRALCDKYNICMVCDEVMAGWYRTGSCFAFQQFGIEPDLVTFAKGSTCGYVPLGGVIASKKIADFFDEHQMMCGLTYSAHPMGCAACVATLNEYKRLKIEENVKKSGKHLGKKLEEMKKKHKCIGDVRYIGLFSIIEFVKNRETREPLVPYGRDPEGKMKKIIGMLKEGGFYTYSHENMIHVSPPLIITKKELDEAFEILDKVLDTVDTWVD